MEDESSSSPQENSDKQGGWTALLRMSRWYWGAIGVIVLAALAQFFQAAPTTLPATVASATLAPNATLIVAYPEEVRPVLREADRAPLVITLQGTGAFTYTVTLSTTGALSFSAPLIFMDSHQQTVAPRAELAVNGCCQSSVVFYLQATTGAWERKSVGVSVYAAPSSATMPGAPALDLTLDLEPVWWTWGRRALLVFADLGLAVAVALAFGGWALDRRQREEESSRERDQKREETERQKRQREARDETQLWQAHLERAKKTCEHDLLAGVTELRALESTLNDTAEHNRRRASLEILLQSYKVTTADPNSLAVERCLERIGARIKVRHAFTTDELEALTYLFDDTPTSEDTTGIDGLVTRLSTRNDATVPAELLQATQDLHHRFEYSLAIRDIAVEMIAAWYESIQKSLPPEEIDAALERSTHLLADPRLAHLPLSRRTHLYKLPVAPPHQYPWANPDRVAEITSHLRIMLDVDASKSAEVPPTSWSPRLPPAGFVRKPHILKFPVYEDAACAAHLLRARLINIALQALQKIDGAPDRVAGTPLPESVQAASSGDFVPFPVPVILTLDTTETDRQLKQVVFAVADAWIALLACSPSIWGGLLPADRLMLARLLHFFMRTDDELRYRLLQHRRSTQCRQEEPNSADRQALTSGFVHQDHDAIIKKLAASIAVHAQDATTFGPVDANRLETWLTLRPAYFTHTVVVALANPALVTEMHPPSWMAWLHLTKRLQDNNVIVHLLAAQTPEAPLLQRVAEDCAIPREQLAALLDDAFGFWAFPSLRRDIPPDGVGGCKIEAISRLLDDDSLDINDEITDALLDKAGGSPSRLLHMMYLILKQRLATLQGDEPEFKLSYMDIVRVVQTYPKDR